MSTEIPTAVGLVILVTTGIVQPFKSRVRIVYVPTARLSKREVLCQVDPLFIEYKYPGVPPAVVNSTNPLLPPKQETIPSSSTDEANASGSVSVNVSVCVRSGRKAHNIFGCRAV